MKEANRKAWVKRELKRIKKNRHGVRFGYLPRQRIVPYLYASGCAFYAVKFTVLKHFSCKIQNPSSAGSQTADSSRQFIRSDMGGVRLQSQFLPSRKAAMRSAL